MIKVKTTQASPSFSIEPRGWQTGPSLWPPHLPRLRPLGRKQQVPRCSSPRETAPDYIMSCPSLHPSREEILQSGTWVVSGSKTQAAFYSLLYPLHPGPAWWPADTLNSCIKWNEISPILLLIHINMTPPLRTSICPFIKWEWKQNLCCGTFSRIKWITHVDTLCESHHTPQMYRLRKWEVASVQYFSECPGVTHILMANKPGQLSHLSSSIQ